MKNITKEIIRSEMVGLLKSLDSGWLKSAEAQLCKNLNMLMDSHFSTINAILAWASFFPGEPELSPFIEYQQQSRQVFLPRSLADFSMSFVLAGRNWKKEMRPGIHGIPEPVPEAGIIYDCSIAGKTIILVPGLAYDRAGNRLGRGKGYYDRFLAIPGHEEIIKIGIAWSMQILESVQTKAHDMPVDWICTETEVFEI